jgi:hypothetical protein
MAYKLGANGPLPSREGEFYANWNPALPPVTQRENEETTPDWTKVRSGRPRPTAAFTSSELAEQGWIGLYLRHDLRVPEGAVEVDAPEWMSEPTADVA